METAGINPLTLPPVVSSPAPPEVQPTEQVNSNGTSEPPPVSTENRIDFLA